MTSKTKDLAAQYGIDLDDVAEWCGLHYGRDLFTESPAKKREWILRYAEMHGLAPQGTAGADLDTLAAAVAKSQRNDDRGSDLAVVSKHALDNLLQTLQGRETQAPTKFQAPQPAQAQTAAGTTTGDQEHTFILRCARGVAINGAIDLKALDTILRDLRGFGLPDWAKAPAAT
ncbi:hypothetical protein [Comamonas testosteroni]|uniref:hypothetical protein n=1 Tax=Comamonas testosteroni TaxID=285 RepID=UPI0026EDA0AF|nr:hypothetical protein [Comamonas testosteroni]